MGDEINTPIVLFAVAYNSLFLILLGISQFIEGKGSPPCSLFFCLGEKWPDPDNRSWERKLITVEVNVSVLKSLLKNNDVT